MSNPLPTNDACDGILLVDKSPGRSSFSLVAALRKRLNVRKIGHAGTLDPFASGVMVMLIGKPFTRLSDKFLEQDKEYTADLHLGIATDTHDLEGQIINRSTHIPTLEQIQEALKQFQGEILQIPPMFSAKKINGQKLYELARKGKTVERKPVKVSLSIDIVSYHYPSLILNVSCSKGTYIRTLAHDLGQVLGSGAHLTSLKRIRSGMFHINQCISASLLDSPSFDRETCRRYLYATH